MAGGLLGYRCRDMSAMTFRLTNLVLGATPYHGFQFFGALDDGIVGDFVAHLGADHKLAVWIGGIPTARDDAGDMSAVTEAINQSGGMRI